MMMEFVSRSLGACRSAKVLSGRNIRMPWTKTLLLIAWTSAGLLAAPVTCPADTAPKVATDKGDVLGQVVDGVRQYLGIPYAAPPVGDLRWAPPQPAASWDQPLDATAFGSSCPQVDSVISAESIDEDCLFLNVYVPDDVGENARLPVMVWIHGGGLNQGAASDYNMSNLALNGKVVAVSINYRLGVYAYYALPELLVEDPAVNFGLQDHQAALRWVQTNIAAFNGDPDHVALFGESGGARAVCLHMVSPQSAGLFHSAIMESGTCKLYNDADLESQVAASEALAEHLGCADEADRLACMRQISPETLNQMNANAFNPDNEDSGVYWIPAIDGVIIPDDPAKLLREGRFNQVPVIMGSNRNEGALMVALNVHLATFKRVDDETLQAAIADYAAGNAEVHDLLAGIYNEENYPSRDLAMAALMTDGMYSCGAYDYAAVFSRYTPTYHYEFNAVVPGAGVDPYMWLGAFHGAEMRYIFDAGLPGLPWTLALSSPQQLLSWRMQRYWANFAATGDPNGIALPEWRAFEEDSPYYQHLRTIALQSVSTDEFREIHHCDVWDTVSGTVRQPYPGTMCDAAFISGRFDRQ